MKKQTRQPNKAEVIRIASKAKVDRRAYCIVYVDFKKRCVLYTARYS